MAGRLKNTLRAARLAKRTLQALWPHARPYRAAIVGVAAISALALALRVLLPWPVKWLFEILGGDAGPLSLERGVVLPALGIAFVLIGLAAAAMEALQRLGVYSLANKTVAGFRARLFGHIMTLPVTYHDRRETGELLTRAVGDTARLRRGLAGVALRLVQSSAQFALVIAVLLVIDPALAGGVLAAGLLAFAAMIGGGQRIVAAARKSRQREGKLASIVEDNLLAVREAQTFRAGTVDPRFEKANARALKGEQKLRKLETGVLFRVELLLTLALGIVVGVGAWRIESGSLTPGDLVLFLTYLLNLFRPLSQFAQQAAQTGRATACAERLLGILERPPLAERADAVEGATPAGGAIEFEKVCVTASKRRRGSRRRLLEEVSFRIEPGQRVAVLGPNGSGKSSLLSQILRLSDPAEGGVRLDGRDLRDYKIEWLRRQFRVVHQNPVLFGATLRENLASADNGVFKQALEKAQLGGLLKGLRDGLDTRVFKRGGLFSGGERQRIAVARALAGSGSIWLLDEPGSGLDAAVESALHEAIWEATAGRTTLWVTHRISLAMRMDRVLILDRGRVVYFGAPSGIGPSVTEREGEFFQAIAKELGRAGRDPGRG